MRWPQEVESTPNRLYEEATRAGKEQPGTKWTRQSDEPGGGASASPPAFVAGRVAPVERGAAATLQATVAPALVRLAFAV
ncbi:MAG: hypothetical protein KatS3mg059_1541 [Thermomicrobiales bacterium]|nr:MAG: hypothetical protein KatS3mg059_1541 [Thermomicrobiales bacterium]